jgi:hypothetical protein
MGDSGATARRNLRIFWVVLTGLPIVSYLILSLAIGLGLSGSY